MDEPSGYLIRRYQALDASAIARLFHASVHGLAKADYTPAQLFAWSPRIRDVRWYETHVKGHEVWIAECDGDVVGFAELESDGHVDMVYVSPKAARQGVATALYEALEAHARDAGLTQVFVEASETALPFFARMGFGNAQRRDFLHDGVALHNYAMEKRLA